MWSMRDELEEFVDNSDDPVEVDRSGVIVALGGADSTNYTFRVKPIKKNSSIVDNSSYGTSSGDEESDD